MVRHDHTVDPVLERASGVVGGQDALHEQRQLRPRAQPVEVVPREPEVRERREHRRGRREQILGRRALELRQEHGVAEELAAAFTADERQVGVAEIPGAPAEGERVEGDDDCAVARLFGPRDEAGADVAIRDPVELEPARAPCLGDLLERVRRGARDDQRHLRRRGRLRDTDLAFLGRDRQHSDGREQERRRRVGAEDVDRDVALDVAGEHPRLDPPPVECREVRAERRLAARTAGDVAESAGIELLLGRPLPVLRPDRPLGRLLGDVDRVLDARTREAHPAILNRPQMLTVAPWCDNAG